MDVLHITCSECSTVFEHSNPRGGRPITCSEPCRKARLRRLDAEKGQAEGKITCLNPVERECRQCEIKFLTSHSSRVFCGARCKSQWHDERRGDRNPARRARYATYRTELKPTRVGDVMTVPCLECGNPFSWKLSVGRRKQLCSDECKARRRRRVELGDKYGITLELYDQLWAEQDGRCAICPDGLLRGTDKYAAVDHNHETGAVRGLLCGRCNLGIGQFADDVRLLSSAIDYLQRSKGRPVTEALAEAREIIALYEHLPPKAV